jgi:hypothetical protein
MKWQNIKFRFFANTFCVGYKLKAHELKDPIILDMKCLLRTRLKKEYSFTNGYGEKFERQQKFVSLLMTELFQSLFKSLK